MEGIRKEILGFLTAILSGGIIRLWYQCLVCFRCFVKHKLIAIGIEDILFWVVAAVFTFVQIYYTSNGIVRWYFVLGIVLGALISNILWKKVEKILKKIYNLQMGEDIAESRKKRYYKG